MGASAALHLILNSDRPQDINFDIFYTDVFIGKNKSVALLYRLVTLCDPADVTDRCNLIYRSFDLTLSSPPF